MCDVALKQLDSVAIEFELQCQIAGGGVLTCER